MAEISGALLEVFKEWYCLMTYEQIAIYETEKLYII